MEVSRKNFIKKTFGLGLGLGGGFITGMASSLFNSGIKNSQYTIEETPFISKGEKQLFIDDAMIANLRGVVRKVHAANKLDHPVLEAEKPWEQGDLYNGKRDRRVYIYGTILQDKETGKFRMWYNRSHNSFYAVSADGINWNRPNIGQYGESNRINLFDFHSPSFIKDDWDPDPDKRYKAVGSNTAIGVEGGRFGYCAAYSSDGLNWNLYEQNPVLLSFDTITLAQDPETGEYLAFHKRANDPRVRGRQIFLAVSKDMQTWSAPKPIMVTDHIDNQEARRLKDGTHSEFYNMSAFPYANQWLGLVTLFRRTGNPPVKGPGQSPADGVIDVRLVHSRDGRNWKHCSDRSPVIPLGPHDYDSGSILGLCNSPVIVDNEMWMYYTAMTTTHGGYLPKKQMTIARAAWRLDGMVSLQSEEKGGFIETLPFSPEGNELFVNADVSNGKLQIEVLDEEGQPIQKYDREASTILRQDSVQIPIQWNNSKNLPSKGPIRLRFYLENGNLYSYTIE